MADLVRFVDSIDASPTVRLDLNDEVSWWVKSFSAPPPRLRRAMSSNAMRDGVFVSSSQYEARTLTIELDLHSSTQDLNATELQKLARELDRADNFLMYQPTGATKPVFFKLFRSDMSQIEQLTGPSAFRRPTIELLAEPFALGLRETLGPYTVNNDPDAGSNGLYFDVTGVIGDVSTPPFIEYSGGAAGGILPGLAVGVRPGASPYPNVARQAESLTQGTDTSVVADAAFSDGSKSRCTFSGTATMDTRVSGSFPTTAPAGSESIGRYRVFVRVAQTVGGDSIKMRCGVGSVFNSTVTLDATTVPQLVDLGIFEVGGAVPEFPGEGGTAYRMESVPGLLIQAQRASGSGNLDIDYVTVMPADSTLYISETVPSSSVAVIDGPNDSIYGASTPTGVTPGVYHGTPTARQGALPVLPPGDSRLVVAIPNPADLVAGNDIATALTVTVHYWPRYVLVRPSAT